MNIIKKAVNKIIFKSAEPLRKCYYRRRKKELKNTSPTIIASDCFGTFMYHNLGLKFMSPTINLFITAEDFIRFVRNLKEYLEAELTEVTDETVNYPVGRLEYGGEGVTVNFMHYKSFYEAKEKWDERKKRVDFSNIYIVQLITEATKEQTEAFDSLPFKNKMLITGKNPTGSKNVVTHNVLLENDYRAGKILKHPHSWSVKRYMDDIDYIEFLNRKN